MPQLINATFPCFPFGNPLTYTHPRQKQKCFLHGSLASAKKLLIGPLIERR